MNAGTSGSTPAEQSAVPAAVRFRAGRLAPPARLAVFISGGGRTLLNLQKAIEAGDLSATIAIVIASKECRGVERARESGLHVIIDRPKDVQRVESLLAEYRIDWVVLAGYLHLLPIPAAYAGRAVNIHPALLPDFGGHGMYGQKVHEAVLKAGKDLSGCTVHLCDDQYDRGKILLQLTCPVLPGDTPETLADRVFVQECKAYPMALQRLIHAGRERQAAPARKRA